MSKDNLPAMYTVDEVAKILRRSPQTIRKLIKRKKIPAVRVGGGWLVSETTLQRLINGEIDTED